MGSVPKVVDEAAHDNAARYFVDEFISTVILLQ